MKIWGLGMIETKQNKNQNILATWTPDGLKGS